MKASQGKGLLSLKTEGALFSVDKTSFSDKNIVAQAIQSEEGLSSVKTSPPSELGERQAIENSDKIENIFCQPSKISQSNRLADELKKAYVPKGLIGKKIQLKGGNDVVTESLN